MKRKKLKQLLKWLETKPNVSVTAGGKHQIVVKYAFWNRPFPIPFKHSTVSGFIIKQLMKQLVDSKVCTKEEFDEKIS